MEDANDPVAMDLDEDELQNDEGSFESALDEDEEAEWARFFPGQEYSANHSALPLVAAFGSFLEQCECRHKDGCLLVSYADLTRLCPASFLESLSSDPAVTLPSMELASYRYHKKWHRDRDVLFGESDVIFSLRLMDWPVTGLKHIKAHYIGRLIAVSGTVIRASGIRPRVMQMSFKCQKCGASIAKLLEDGRFNLPISCSSPQCKTKKFEPEFELATSVDWQSIRIQESIQGYSEAGRMPRIFEIELLGDLADSCVPGDSVTVTGIVKREAIDKASVRKAKNKAVFYMYLEAKSVLNLKQQMGARVASDEFEAGELMAIRRVASDPEVFRNVINSLCPSIYGHELVKAGLCLTLFGGTQKKKNNSDSGLRIRGDSHVLIVGDPGLGKSQMLRAISNVAPRGVYVCGSYSSSSGLTVTLLKEANTGDYVLEAGALVLADQGVCCIDEFDKMPNEHQSLLEAMEQQNISVAKAGIVCTLMARTSVIAAANPIGGHYDRAKTIAENLKISPALLSRFDLIFILLDKPNEATDKQLSEHVMALHGNKTNSNNSNAQNNLSSDEGIIVWQSQIRGASQSVSSQAGMTLHSRLKISENSAKFVPIPAKALRKYIGYARRFVHPKLSEEAGEILQKFYLRIRSEHATRDSTPITNRQLESLIRLSEARARLELRDVVTKKDAEEVVELMEECMFSAWEDQWGNFDVRRSTGMSKAKMKNAFVAELNKRKEKSGNAIFTLDQFRSVAKEMGILAQIDDFYSFIEEINIQGFFTKTGRSSYELR